jgi:hypothetical protein
MAHAKSEGEACKSRMPSYGRTQLQACESSWRKAPGFPRSPGTPACRDKTFIGSRPIRSPQRPPVATWAVIQGLPVARAPR